MSLLSITKQIEKNFGNNALPREGSLVYHILSKSLSGGADAAGDDAGSQARPFFRLPQSVVFYCHDSRRLLLLAKINLGPDPVLCMEMTYQENRHEISKVDE